jgi:hypothetical protein
LRQPWKKAQRFYGLDPLTQRLNAVRESLKLEFRLKLRSGALIATGISPAAMPDEPARIILADRWQYLIPDFRFSSASGSASTIEGILVFAPEMLRREAPRPRARFSAAEVTRWYQGWVARPENSDRPPSSEADRIAAERELGFTVPRDLMRELRRDLAPEHWKQKGRRRAG